jgi:hypothetical protein
MRLMENGRTETGIVTAIVAVASVLGGRVLLPHTGWSTLLILAIPLATYLCLEWAVRKGKL